MKNTATQICCFAAVALTLVGCASSDERYPSLAVRDAERAQGRTGGTLTPTHAPSENVAFAAPSPVSIDSVLEATSMAGDAHILFDLESEDVSRLVEASRGLGPEDDIYARALIGLASLTSLRAQTAGALADLDSMEALAATRFAPLGDVHEAQNYVTGLIADQDKALDQLSQALSQ